VLALMRLSGSRLLSGASASFVELFRNLPLILVIYTAYYVMRSRWDWRSRHSSPGSWHCR